MKKLFIALFVNIVLFIGLPNFKVNAMSITIDIPFSYVPVGTDSLTDLLSGGKLNIKGYTNINDWLADVASTKRNTYNFLKRQSTIVLNKLSQMALDGESSLTDLNNLVIPFNVSDLAYHMGYNQDWWKKYAVQPTVFPQINETISLGSVTFGRNTYNFSSIGYGNFSAYINGIVYNNLYYPFAVRLHIGSNYYYYIVGKELSPGNNNIYDSAGFWDGVSDPTYYPDFSSFTYPYFLSISDAIEYSQTGQYFDSEGLLEGPDIIGIGDLPDYTYDVFFPKIDGLEGLSLNQFLKWMQEQMDLGKDVVGLDDLIDDNVDILVYTDGTTGEIEYTDTRPVIKVIENDIADDEDTNPDPDATPKPTDTPPIPPLPDWIFPSDIPNKPVDHTVLAEIIDSTQQTIPTELMTLIWSTFGLLVVGGLIYILHK